MYARHLTASLLDAWADTPVVILHGARQVGKTTLARHLAEHRLKARYLTLDDQTTLAVARRDPVGFVEGLGRSAVLDEVQRAPDLLLAIKASVDRDRRPGRFLLTGSANLLTLPRMADALVGRAEICTLWPLSQGEIAGARERFVEALLGKDSPDWSASLGKGTPRRDSVLSRVLAGGFPEPLARRGADRRRAWFEAYLETVLVRDVRELSNIAGLAELPQLLRIVAARAGGLLNAADVARDAGLNVMTARRYLTLLEATFLARMLPPWFSNRLKRLVKSPKAYLGDTGLLAYLWDVSPERLAGDQRALGALLENFVFSELSKQCGWIPARPRLYHFRDHAGLEVDFVLENPAGGGIAGVEVKAAATLRPADWKGLSAFAAALGPRFLRGVVLYLGREVVPLGPRIEAVPLGALWQAGSV